MGNGQWQWVMGNSYDLWAIAYRLSPITYS